MFCAEGTKVIMTRGNYGIPMPIRITEHCDDCGDDLLDTDVVRLVVLWDGRPIIQREETLGAIRGNGGVMVLTITQDESRRMPVGRYNWRLLLVRTGEVCNTLISAVLEVVP